MLENDFFYITTLQQTGGPRDAPLADTEALTLRVMLELNPAHPIFEGHFPGQPVVPGVCMMQMVKEITEGFLGRETRLIKADQLKFLALLIPAESRLLRMDLKLSALDNGQTGVDAQLLNDSTLFFKFKGLFSPIL